MKSFGILMGAVILAQLTSLETCEAVHAPAENPTVKIAISTVDIRSFATVTKRQNIELDGKQFAIKEQSFLILSKEMESDSSVTEEIDSDPEAIQPMVTRRLQNFVNREAKELCGELYDGFVAVGSKGDLSDENVLKFLPLNSKENQVKMEGFSNLRPRRPNQIIFDGSIDGQKINKQNFRVKVPCK